MKEDDKIVLENPGYIRLGKEQMRKGGRSDPRNNSLMKMTPKIIEKRRCGVYAGLYDDVPVEDQD